MSLSAAVWSRLLYGPDTSVFDLLNVGDRFYFPTNDKRTPCVKLTKSGKYRIAAPGDALDGRVFRTGRNTAVKRFA